MDTVHFARPLSGDRQEPRRRVSLDQLGLSGALHRRTVEILLESASGELQSADHAAQVQRTGDF